MLVTGRPDPRIGHGVDRYVGYREHTDGSIVHRQVAVPAVVLIIGWRAPMDVIEHRSSERGASGVDSFVAGVFDSHCAVRSAGTTEGIELRFSPLTAARLLGLPMMELTNRAVSTDDLPGGWLPRLRTRIAGAADWPQRFALLDAALADRLAATTAVDARLRYAWQRLVATGGRLPVATLADEIGWSGRHLAAVFRRQVGLTPKGAARLLRFQQAYTAPAAGAPDDPVNWSAVAAGCGYYDQAHLIRDFRQYAGTTPGAVRPAGR